jgi:hypothetical protein
MAVVRVLAAPGTRLRPLVALRRLMAGATRHPAPVRLVSARLVFG